MLFIRLFDLRLFGLPIGVWEGLQLLIVALPLDFSLTFFDTCTHESADQYIVMHCEAIHFTVTNVHLPIIRKRKKYKLTLKALHLSSNFLIVQNTYLEITLFWLD